ncbi:MAG: hypothetical protein KQH59_18250 [Desulfobulbaceae bacterium]|nr:hypothetical protein [Desulfobulbaceae bacterium]
MLAAKGKLRFPEPNIPMALRELRRLIVVVRQFDDIGSMLTRIDLQLTDPDTTDNRAVIEQVAGSLPFCRLPMAAGHFEVEVDGRLIGPVVIHFFDKRFLTVGILLHELAHVVVPSADHDQEFYRALGALECEWKKFAKETKWQKITAAARLKTCLSWVRGKISEVYQWPL